MTVSIAKMSINYYLENAVTGDGQTRDLTSYYTEAKAPPGTWFGAGVAGLSAVAVGQEVTEETARAVYEHQADPGTGEALGRPLMKTQAAPDGAKTPAGRAAKGDRQGVAGFDLTFSPPKSVSALWAVAGPELQGRIHAAHRQATEETLAWVEANVIQSRAGHAGVAHVAVSGMVASLFDHWDSRAGDPQLHTHAVIANRVQRASDGQWVTLDSYTLHRHVVAISETYNSVLFDRLAEHVGAVAESRSDVDVDIEKVLADHVADDVAPPADYTPGHRVELAGVPDRLIEEFSTRSAQITARTDELIAAYVDEHSRRPGNREILKLRQQATLENRPDKADIAEVTLPQKITAWRRRALAAGTSPEDVVRDAVGRDITLITPTMLDETAIATLGQWTLTDSSQRRTTFTRANVRASAERILRLVRCQSFAERTALVDQVVDAALGSAVDLTPHRSAAPEATDPFVSLRGESVFDHHRHAGVYTTQQIMDDEAFLIGRATAGDSPRLADSCRDTLRQWRSADDHTLSEDQYAASVDVLTSDTGLSAIIGPAGTGKTTTMAAITDAWHADHGPGSVIGLAPSAVAAGVLGDEIAVASDNVSKWLFESAGDGAAARADRVRTLQSDLDRLTAVTGRRSAALSARIEQLHAKLAAEYSAQAKYQLKAGQLLIIDEASMVPTAQLAELGRQAEAAGAKVLLVGDPAQLEAVDAGGFLGHMERNLAHSTLNQVWRFRNEWERAASLRLRRGDADVLDVYDNAGRLHGDPDTDPADAAYTAWRADQDAGLSSILIASDNATVTELNQRAHADRVTACTVDIEQTATLREKVSAGVGDVILARRNDRKIRDSSGAFVANGTRMTITAIRDDGAVTARVEATDADIVLDPDYLAGSVELGYATTAHRSQGVTVDTAHAVTGPGLSRELFYVSMTRGRQANHAYVDFDEHHAHSPDQWELLAETTPGETPAEVLRGVVSRSQAERSAHEVAEDELGWANDVGRLCYEADYLHWATRTERTRQWIAEHYPPEVCDRLYSDAAWQRLAGVDPARTHTGDVDPGDTAEAILARCRPQPVTLGAGPAGMLPAVESASAGQEAVWSKLGANVDDQVAARLAVLRKDPPEWFEQLETDYPEPEQQARALTAAVVWRAVSKQTDEPTPFGTEPPAGDHLRPYWDRLQLVLAAERTPDDQPATADHAPEIERDGHDLAAFASIDWDQVADSAELRGLDDVLTSQPAMPQPAPAPPYASPDTRRHADGPDLR